jgi:hypothetical protein
MLGLESLHEMFGRGYDTITIARFPGHVKLHFLKSAHNRSCSPSGTEKAIREWNLGRRNREIGERDVAPLQIPWYDGHANRRHLCAGLVMVAAVQARHVEWKKRV